MILALYLISTGIFNASQINHDDLYSGKYPQHATYLFYLSAILYPLTGALLLMGYSMASKILCFFSTLSILFSIDYPINETQSLQKLLYFLIHITVLVTMLVHEEPMPAKPKSN